MAPARHSLAVVLARCAVLARCPVLALCAVLALWPVSPANANSGSTTIYVARRGWHIDVGMAAADLLAPLNQAAAYLPGTRYFFFGFADKHYLLAVNHNAPVLLSALWPGAGIILTTGLTNSPAEAFGTTHVIALTLSQDQMRDLRSFIWRSLRTQDDTLKIYRQGPYEDSVYFLATQKYSAFHTCNTWGAQALRAAGFRVHTAGVIFAGQLWTQARRLERLQAPILEVPALGGSNARAQSFLALWDNRTAGVLPRSGVFPR
jgi:Protein of unknown function (DUF2459)